jgi:hypothetical protein
MSTTIICPQCRNAFALEDVLTEDVERSLKEQYEKKFQLSLQQLNEERQSLVAREQEFEEKKKRENMLFREKLEKELEKQRSRQEEDIRKNLANDYENRIKLLLHSNQEQEERLKTARQKELEFLQKEHELKNREQELEISLQKKLLEERNKLAAVIRQEEHEKTTLRETEYQLKMEELKKQLDDQKKLADEMRRRAEQGSMQLQGEVQELLLEEILRNAFPFDMITEVGKGVKGADCIQVVRNNFGQECGKIIYESKRTKDFSVSWIEKLKADMRSLGAEIAVIVTQAMPKDMDCFGEREGVWICTFADVKSLAYALRDGIIKIFNAAKSQENKGDKMQLLYNYLTGAEFAGQWKAVREGFMNMRLSIQREKDAMEKLWKAREKQLEKILLNAAHIKGSIEGISGSDAVDLNLIGDEDPALPGS